MRRSLLLFLAVLGSISALGQANLGPITTPRINGTWYVGSILYPTISSALAAACAAGGGTVLRPYKVGTTDTPTNATGGCTAVELIDQSTTFTAYYVLSGSLYVAGPQTFNGALAVTGAVTLASTLAVTGATTLAALNTTGNIVATGYIGGSAYFGGQSLSVPSLNTNVTLFSYAMDGMIVVRDATSGGVALVLLDGYTGPVIVSSSITGLSATVSGSTFVVQLTSGTVPRLLDYSFIRAQ